GYAANREKAEFVRSGPKTSSARTRGGGGAAREPEAELQEVYTPGCASISDLAAFLNIAEAQTMKAVCYGAGGRTVMAVVRGDLDINEVKLANILYRAGINASDLHL